MRWLIVVGLLLMGFGLVTAVVAAGRETTVSGYESQGSYFPSKAVKTHNIGLIAEQQVGVMMGCATGLIGTLLFVAGLLVGLLERAIQAVADAALPVLEPESAPPRPPMPPMRGGFPLRR